jgi:hypothetical protein
MADTLLSSIPGITPSLQLALKKGVFLSFLQTYNLYLHRQPCYHLRRALLTRL